MKIRNAMEGKKLLLLASFLFAIFLVSSISAIATGNFTIQTTAKDKGYNTLTGILNGSIINISLVDGLGSGNGNAENYTTVRVYIQSAGLTANNTLIIINDSTSKTALN